MEIMDVRLVDHGHINSNSNRGIDLQLNAVTSVEPVPLLSQLYEVTISLVYRWGNGVTEPHQLVPDVLTAVDTTT